MAGGEPAGINILPGELGCLTNSIRMSTTTSTGKTSTTPSGMETAELPRSRSGLWKNANLEAMPLFFDRFSSEVGSPWEGPADPFRRKMSMATSKQPAYGCRDSNSNNQKESEREEEEKRKFVKISSTEGLGRGLCSCRMRCVERRQYRGQID